MEISSYYLSEALLYIGMLNVEVAIFHLMINAKHFLTGL